MDWLDVSPYIIFMLGIIATILMIPIIATEDEKKSIRPFIIAALLLSGFLILSDLDKFNKKDDPEHEAVVIEAVKSEETTGSDFSKKRVEVKDKDGKELYSIEGNYKVEFTDGTVKLIEESGREQIRSIDEWIVFSVIDLDE